MRNINRCVFESQDVLSQATLDDGVDPGFPLPDTIVHAMVTPLEGLPPFASAVGMVGAHIAIHFPVPSVSGQAVLTILATAKVQYEDWVRWVFPIYGTLLVVGLVAIGVAIAVGL